MKKPCVIVFLLLAVGTVYAQEPIRIDTAIYNEIVNGTYDIRNKFLIASSSSLNFDEFQYNFAYNYMNQISVDRNGYWSKDLNSAETTILQSLLDIGRRELRAGRAGFPSSAIFNAIIICNDTHGVVIYYMNNDNLPSLGGMGDSGLVITSRIFFEIKRR